MIIAAVVMRAAGDEIGKLFAADEIAAADFDAVEADGGSDLVDRGFDRVIGRRLAEAAHRFLRRLVRGDRDRAILHALDLVGPDNRADRLAELERGATSGSAHNVVR